MAATIARGLLNAYYIGATGGTEAICRGRAFAYVQDRVLCALRSDCEHENPLRRSGMLTIDGVCRNGHSEAGIYHSCDPQLVEDLHIIRHVHSDTTRRLAHRHRALIESACAFNKKEPGPTAGVDLLGKPWIFVPIEKQVRSFHPVAIIRDNESTVSSLGVVIANSHLGR